MRFYDSNILLYAYSQTPAEFHKRDIARHCLAEGNWCISAQVLQEFYTNAIRERPGRVRMLAPHQAAGLVDLLESRVKAVVDTALVQRGIELHQRHQLSYWDGAIIAAAIRCCADEILTEDLNAGQVIEGVRVVNPFVTSTLSTPN